jgi:Mg/Co/Ni transporter MgtE
MSADLPPARSGFVLGLLVATIAGLISWWWFAPPLAVVVIVGALVVGAFTAAGRR